MTLIDFGFGTLLLLAFGMLAWVIGRRAPSTQQGPSPRARVEIEAEEDAALDRILRDPEHIERFDDETQAKADRAARRERLKGGRR